MSKIPLIAITPEAEEDDDHNYLGMTDTLTDVENIDSDPENESKTNQRLTLSKLKIKINNSASLTDVEDLDLSDYEDDDHTNRKLKTCATPDNFDVDLDSAATEETCRTRSKGIKGKKRLHTQFSVTSGDNTSLLYLNNPDEGVTDVEDVCVSDNENFIKSPDYTITDDMLENTVLTKIALKMNDTKTLGVSPIPPKVSVTDTEILDSESNDDEKLAPNKKVRRRKPRAHRHPNRASLTSENESQIGRGIWNVNKQKIEKYSDNDNEENCTLNFVKRKAVTITLPQRNDGANTDVEVLNSSADEMPFTVLARLKVTDTDHESVTDDEAYNTSHTYENITPPRPYRKRVDVIETTHGTPITKVSPLSDSFVRDSLTLYDQPDTDEEDFSDTEALLFAEMISHGSTPDISIFDDGYEQATESYKERSRTPVNEYLTDTEYLMEKPKKVGSKFVSKDGLLGTKEYDDTDIENISISDVEEIDRIRSASVTPTAIREISSANILSKEGIGPFSASTRLEVNRRVNYLTSTSVTPVLTDTEDVYASAMEDEVFARPEFEIPDESSHVHLQSTSRIDIDAPNEVIYLKGGDGFREVYTDIEDMNETDTDDDHECKYKKKVSVDILGDDKVLVSMQNSCRKRNLCHTSAASKNGKDWDASGKTFAEKQISRKGEKTLDAVQKGWQASPESNSPRTSAPFKATHEEGSPEDAEHSLSSQPGQQQRQVPDQHHLSDEMKQLLQDMEKESKK